MEKAMGRPLKITRCHHLSFFFAPLQCLDLPFLYSITIICHALFRQLMSIVKEISPNIFGGHSAQVLYARTSDNAFLTKRVLVLSSIL